MRFYIQLGIGICSLFLIGTGCTNQSGPMKPPVSQQEVQKEVKEKAEKEKLPKSAPSLQSVYLNQQEKAEVEDIKKQPIVYKGSQHSKKVALTFDDGPDVELTNKILAILKKEQVPATFFVTGIMVKEYPEMLKKIYEHGHVIGNHTWSHPQLTKLSTSKLDQEMDQTNQLVEKLLGKKMRLMRPPYGATNSQVQQQLKKKGFTIVNWDVDTNDWRGYSGPKIEGIVKSQLANGSIILQHNSGNTLQGTVDALPNIIKYLKAQKYQLVTVDQLLDMPPYQEKTK